MKHQCLHSRRVLFCELPDSSEFQKILWEFYPFDCHLLSFAGPGAVTQYQFQAVFSGLVRQEKKKKILSLKFSMQRIISSNWYPGHERLVAPNAFSLIIVVS